MEEEKKGLWSCLVDFWGSLFELSFNELITMRIIKVLYAIGVLIAGIVGIWLIVEARHQVGFRVLLYIIAAPTAFILLVIILRVCMELVLTLFRIEENTRKPVVVEETTTQAAVEEVVEPAPAPEAESGE